jgi:hypothetical protein|nr:MAG TPA: hypothetical protein [Caudoviricetes sp.]
MSKLGKIYEVRYGDDYYSKIVYPVVYENQAQWLCKVPGSSDIIHVYKDSSRKVYTASEFLEKIESKKPDFTVYVLVKPGEEVNFEKYRERTKNEFALMRAKQTLNAAGKRLENYVKHRDLYDLKVKESAKHFEECRQEVARLEKLVEEEKGNEQ